MGNGRYVKQDNGDYIHFNDEEYYGMKASAALAMGVIMIAIGIWIGWNTLIYVGLGFSLVGLIALIIIDKMFGESWWAGALYGLGFALGTIGVGAFLISVFSSQ